MSRRVLLTMVIAMLLVAVVGGSLFAAGQKSVSAVEESKDLSLIKVIEPEEFLTGVLKEIGVPYEVHADFAAAVAAPSKKLGVKLDRPIKIGFSSPSFDISDAWNRWYWGLHLRLVEAGIPFEMNIQGTSRHDSHDEQLAQVENLIASKVDYIVLGPTELDAQHEAIKKVHAAGIPLIIMNFTRPIPWDDKTLMYVAFDHEFGGYLSGMNMVEYSGGKGKLALLRMVPGALDDQRWGGAKAVIDQTNIKMVYETFAHANRQEAFEATIDIMTAHPDLNMIYATSSAMALGAAAALDTMGKAGTVGVWGFGGTIDEIDAMLANKMTGSVFRFQDDGGVAIGEAILRHLEGRANMIPRSYMGEMAMAHSGMAYDEFVALANKAYRYTGDKLGTGLKK